MIKANDFLAWCARNTTTTLESEFNLFFAVARDERFMEVYVAEKTGDTGNRLFRCSDASMFGTYDGETGRFLYAGWWPEWYVEPDRRIIDGTHVKPVLEKSQIIQRAHALIESQLLERRLERQDGAPKPLELNDVRMYIMPYASMEEAVRGTICDLAGKIPVVVHETDVLLAMNDSAALVADVADRAAKMDRWDDKDAAEYIADIVSEIVVPGWKWFQTLEKDDPLRVLYDMHYSLYGVRAKTLRITAEADGKSAQASVIAPFLKTSMEQNEALCSYMFSNAAEYVKLAETLGGALGWRHADHRPHDDTMGWVGDLPLDTITKITHGRKVLWKKESA